MEMQYDGELGLITTSHKQTGTTGSMVGLKHKYLQRLFRGGGEGGVDRQTGSLCTFIIIRDAF